MLARLGFKLQKLTIRKVKERSGGAGAAVLSAVKSAAGAGDAWEAMFNPTSLSQSWENTYVPAPATRGIPAAHKASPKPEYKRTEVGDLGPFTLIIDDTGVADYGVLVGTAAAGVVAAGMGAASTIRGLAGMKGNVRRKVDALLEMALFDEKAHEPPALEVSWGLMGPFRCRLKDAKATYTLFNRSGEPLRAEIEVTFVAISDEIMDAKVKKMSSPDVTHERVLKAGDALPMIAAEIYGDPSYHVKLARANGLDSLRGASAGARLRCPPVKR